MSNGKIPRNNSINNLTNFNNTKFSLSNVTKRNKIINIINALNNNYLNFCPYCKNKNMPSEVYLTFDLIFCSVKCRSKMCDGITMEDIIEIRNFKN